MEKKYAVMTSGHGSYFRFEEIHPKLKTLEEAIKEARHCESIGDTIGCQARVVDMKQGRIVPHY